ncbi:Restriction endonuclease subunit S [Candidatus Desulfarcum epimagneticum]|uniref:Restriction endonuclease subunit S n=1 Tax=uncultured Desulfobacteraceae bacterium TaxID=218296 RepID=A0A484HE95_9BACT|nr:Restriction endonuclease subunit S [uncultured Desulfobacteraceae bacterium]
MFEGPEKKFQRHIADYFIREHGYALLKRDEIIDKEYYFASDHLIAFLRATQPETFESLEKDYGTDAGDEIFKALKAELRISPLWLIIRNGLVARGLEFKLYYPKPRSSESAANLHHSKNRITFIPELTIKGNKRIDFGFFLNGLPIITMELKHEKNQTAHDAVKQYADRDHSDRIFQLPFLHIAADNYDVMVATDPKSEKNFRWHNAGLENKTENKNEYPVEFLYRDVLAKETILEALSFFLIYVPQKEAEQDKPERPAFTIFPRYHQSRMVQNVANDALGHFTKRGDIGKKYLIDHSAGSGKTLSICWLADRLHSLYKSGGNEKMLDMVFVLTDRKSLDKNIRDEFDHFSHLHGVVGYAKKARDLKRFLKNGRPIVASTQQKFKWILGEIEGDPDLKKRRVAFLIDEAHRSQEGKMGAAIRTPFRNSNEPARDTADAEIDPQDELAEIIRAHDSNQLFVAFTATPSPATIQLFGEPFDTYSEAEAIQEGYILDVAVGIISYKTLYNLHCPIIPGADKETLYPAGVVSKALKNVAFQDEGLIQYKAEVMLRIFEEKIKSLIDGRAKAMIVATSRLAGLRYFQIIKNKIKERDGVDYKVLYAFSDFIHPDTNESITEIQENGLSPGELIEDRFAGEDYRLMVVASKFLAGFNQPLLAGMFLDKSVFDRNAVQTVSRLNRCHGDKKTVVVVDFTNNAHAILKAFNTYRKGPPLEASEPDKHQCVGYYDEIMKSGVFSYGDAKKMTRLIAAGQDSQLEFVIKGFRKRFQDRFVQPDDRKKFVYLLARFVKSYHFLTCFFTYPKHIGVFAVFAEYVGPQLIKPGSVSELMEKMRKTRVVKASVQHKGEVSISGKIKLKRGRKGGGGPPAKKVSVRDMIEKISKKFQISDEEALCIKEVTEEKMSDNTIQTVIAIHKEDIHYLENTYTGQVNDSIQNTYEIRGRYEDLGNPKYIDKGAIFDAMALTVIQHGLQVAA